MSLACGWLPRTWGIYIVTGGRKGSASRLDWKLDKADLSKSYYYKAQAYKNAGDRRVCSEYSEPVRLAPRMGNVTEM